MKQEVNFCQFVDAFRSMGREGQFSYDGLRLLFDYLEEGFDGEYTLDVIALCCEYVEEPVEDVFNNYSLCQCGEDICQCGKVGIVEEYLSDNTQFLGFTNEEKTIVLYSEF